MAGIATRFPSGALPPGRVKQFLRRAWGGGAISVNDGEAVVFSGTDGTLCKSAGWVPRIRLSSAFNMYVRTDGSDSNNGLANTAGGAFLTIQKALDTLTTNYDIAGITATINVAAGTYTGANTLRRIGPYGAININGVGSTTIISTTNADAFVTGLTGGSAAAGYTLQNMKIQTTTGGHAVHVTRGGIVIIGAGVEFGACAQDHVVAEYGSTAIMLNNYTISGGAIAHLVAQYGGVIVNTGITVTLTGTPAFSSAFAFAFANGSIQGNGNTFSGSATGPRYSATANGVIFTNGGGANYFPGNSAGATATGGQYI